MKLTQKESKNASIYIGSDMEKTCYKFTWRDMDGNDEDTNDDLFLLHKGR